MGFQKLHHLNFTSGAIVYYSRRNKDQEEKYEPVPTENPSGPSPGTQNIFTTREEAISPPLNNDSERMMQTVEQVPAPIQSPPVPHPTTTTISHPLPLYLNMMQSSTQPAVAQYALPSFQILPVVAPLANHSQVIQVSNQQPLYATPSYNGHLPAITGQEPEAVESSRGRFTGGRVQELDSREDGNPSGRRGIQCCCKGSGVEVDGSADTKKKWYKAVEGVMERQREDSASSDKQDVECACSDQGTGKIREVKRAEGHVYEKLKTAEKCDCENTVAKSVRSRRNNSDPPTFFTATECESNSGLAARYRDTKYRSEPSLM